MASPIEDRPPLMTITPAAAARVRAILAKADRPVAGLRVGVKNGGCAGMAYTMELARHRRPATSWLKIRTCASLYPEAILFLIGARMDFQASKMSRVSPSRVPTRHSACGCGRMGGADPRLTASGAGAGELNGGGWRRPEVRPGRPCAVRHVRRPMRSNMA